MCLQKGNYSYQNRLVSKRGGFPQVYHSHSTCTKLHCLVCFASICVDKLSHNDYKRTARDNILTDVKCKNGFFL